MKVVNVFGESLEDVMLAKEFDVSKISVGAQIKRENITNYLSGKCVPTLPHAVKIAEFCGCSLDYLLGLIDEPRYGEYSVADMQFYEHYLTAIKARGITHYRVAKDLGVNFNIWCKWRDGAIPMLKVFTALAKYLGVTADSLVGRERK